MIEIQRLARRERLSVGEWVRRTLREAREQKPLYDAESKLKAIRRAAEFAFPTTDAEVLQEIVHRYAALDKREAIGPAFQVVLGVVDDVLPIEKADVVRAGEIVQNPALLSARDSVHIAVMERHGIR